MAIIALVIKYFMSAVGYCVKYCLVGWLYTV